MTSAVVSALGIIAVSIGTALVGIFYAFNSSMSTKTDYNYSIEGSLSDGENSRNVLAGLQDGTQDDERNIENGNNHTWDQHIAGCSHHYSLFSLLKDPNPRPIHI